MTDPDIPPPGVHATPAGTPTDPDVAAPADDHFVVLMGLVLSYGEDATVGRCTLRPSMWATGTTRPRLGILATLVDIVAGHAPAGPVSPTLDLRVQLLADPPAEGEIVLDCKALRAGRRFIVAETTLAVEGEAPFAFGTTTFLNNAMVVHDTFTRPRPVPEVVSFDEIIDARVVDGASLEIVPRVEIGNGPGRTVQGGVQATLAELTAAHLLGDPAAQVDDLEIRYLDRVRTGPLRATARAIGGRGDATTMRIDLRDVGDPDTTAGAAGRLISAVSLGVRSSAR